MNAQKIENERNDKDKDTYLDHGRFEALDDGETCGMGSSLTVFAKDELGDPTK